MACIMVVVAVVVEDSSQAAFDLHDDSSDQGLFFGLLFYLCFGSHIRR